jgi:hypothetical protein
MTLPPAESFDARVERAIGDSDVFIFLISPQSVTRGRYTLTEVAFAKRKWPNPNARVLPVMLLPTPLDAVPNYLKAVTILEPEGNAAAETAAAVTFLDRKSTNLDLLILTAVASLSGLVTFLIMRYAAEFLKVQILNWGKETVGPSVVPGLLFGAVVAYSCYRFGSRERFTLATAVALIVVGWILAVQVAALVTIQLSQYHATVSNSSIDASIDSESGQPSISTKDVPYVGCIGGAIGGLIGGALTALGASLANGRFRRMETWSLTLAAAIAAGLLLETTAYMKEGSTFMTAVFFIVWQSAVAASIAYGLRRDWAA